MKRSRFSDEQIIAILKEQENGLPTKDVCRQAGISSATFYKCKAKYGGLKRFRCAQAQWREPAKLADLCSGQYPRHQSLSPRQTHAVELY